MVLDADEKAYDAWVAGASALAFTNCFWFAEAEKVWRHAPVVVTPVVVSAGGGVMVATTCCSWLRLDGTVLVTQVNPHKLPNGVDFGWQHLGCVLVASSR